MADSESFAESDFIPPANEVVKVMHVAGEHAANRGAAFVEAIDLCAALLDEASGCVRRALREVGVNLDVVLDEMASLVEGGSTSTPAKIATLHAMKEAQRGGYQAFDIADMLQGLLKSDCHIVNSSFRKGGLTPENVDRAIERLRQE